MTKSLWKCCLLPPCFLLRLSLEFGHGLCWPQSKQSIILVTSLHVLPGAGRVCKLLNVQWVLSAAWGEHEGHLDGLSSSHLGPWVSFLERGGRWEGTNRASPSCSSAGQQSHSLCQPEQQSGLSTRTPLPLSTSLFLPSFFSTRPTSFGEPELLNAVHLNHPRQAASTRAPGHILCTPAGRRTWHLSCRWKWSGLLIAITHTCFIHS